MYFADLLEGESGAQQDVESTRKTLCGRFGLVARKTAPLLLSRSGKSDRQHGSPMLISRSSLHKSTFIPLALRLKQRAPGPPAHSSGGFLDRVEVSSHGRCESR